jgi:holin-like protein
LALLLLFQAFGELAARAAHLPLPGPVLGLLALLPCLRWDAIRQPVSACAELLLAHLSLLFVPVGVGVVSHLELVTQHGAGLLVAVVASTWIGMSVTAIALVRLTRRVAEPETAKP